MRAAACKLINNNKGQMAAAICPLLLTKVIERIHIRAVSLDTEVAVDAAGNTAAACLGNLLALVNRLSRRDEQRGVVLVIRHIAPL